MDSLDQQNAARALLRGNEELYSFPFLLTIVAWLPRGRVQAVILPPVDRITELFRQHLV